LYFHLAPKKYGFRQARFCRQKQVVGLTFKYQCKNKYTGLSD
jgi:hypothetical protein